jgi:AraC-like DNA-binding protein
MLTGPSHGDLLISEIAFRSGFLDQPTFNRMFKRRYAITPARPGTPRAAISPLPDEAAGRKYFARTRQISDREPLPPLVRGWRADGTGGQ